MDRSTSSAASRSAAARRQVPSARSRNATSYCGSTSACRPLAPDRRERARIDSNPRPPRDVQPVLHRARGSRAMTVGPEPVAARPYARCGTLRLDHVRTGAGAVAVEAAHGQPHFGYVLAGHFVVREARSAQEVVAGDLRFSSHGETLQLEMPGGLEALVGELVGVDSLPPRPSARVAADPRASVLLRRIAADPTHPALVEVERWALAEHCRASESSRPAAWTEDLVLELGSAPIGARAVRSWSAHSGRHRSTLHRSFRRSLGLDPSGWILRERLRRAWERLETAQPLVEIAIDCGFA